MSCSTRNLASRWGEGFSTSRAAPRTLKPPVLGCLPAEDQVQLRAVRTALALIADFVRLAQAGAADVPSGVWRGVMAHGQVVHE
jgi:hypothetical protein